MQPAQRSLLRRVRLIVLHELDIAAGEIVAVDAGDATCHTPFRSDEIKAFGGLASVIVRRTGSGTVILRAESEGLEAGETEL